MIRLLIVDDHPVVRAGYQRLLEQGGDATVVAQAGSVDEGWTAYRRHDPDVTVTDLAMPGSGGLELLRRIRDLRRDAKVIVFSMHCSAMLIDRAFALGAGGFVAKSCPPEHLIEAVASVVQGRRYSSTGTLPPADRAAPVAATDGGLRSLTPREFEILRLIARGESTADCARALNLSTKTVSNLQSLIKEKLGVATTAALVHLALRHGLVAVDGAAEPHPSA